MSKQQLFYSLLITFFGINLLTAGTTDLSHDEAYYWMYAEFLDWGYFDHPPMVALFNFLGFQLIENEVGVRLFSILATCGGLFFTYKLTNERHPILFWGMAFGMFAFNILGFTSVPDNGLFFFAALFFWAYDRFLRKESWTNIVFLIIAITGMLYSKYHTVFVVLFTVLSNLKLLKNKYLYLVAIASTLLYLPHILWQFEHEFPSLKYHLSDRTSGFSITYLFDYVTGTILYFGPILLLMFIYPILHKKAENKLDSALKANFIGFLLFFLLMSIKGRVEMNWNVTATIPFMVLSIKAWERWSSKWQKWSSYGVAASVLMLLLMRGVIVIDAIPVNQEKIAEMKGWKEFIGDLDSTYNQAEFVATTYQMASKFSFYTERYAYCKTFGGRHNQYTLWSFNDTLQGKSIVYLGDIHRSGTMYNTPQNRKLYVSAIPEFYTYEETTIQYESDTLIAALNDTVSISVTIKTPFKRDLCKDKYRSAIIHHFFDLSWERLPGSIAPYPDFGQNMISLSHGEYDVILNNPPNETGTYYMTLSIITNGITEYLPADTLVYKVNDLGASPRGMNKE